MGWRLLAVALLLASAQACGSDSPTSPVPSLTLSLSGESVSVAQGNTAILTATITRRGGFDGAVSLTATGVPPGVVVSAGDIAPGAAMGTLSIVAAGSADPLTASVTLEASGAGVRSEPRSLGIVVLLASGLPHFVAIEAGGDVIMTDFALDAVIRVDPTSGERTIVSDGATGSGPVLRGPQGIAVEADGRLVVVDLILDAVIRVDPVTGDRMTLSDADTGSGPPLGAPRSVAVEADGNLVVTDGRSIVRVHPLTGARTIVSSVDRGSGTGLFGVSEDIAIEADGGLVVTNESSVQRVHPITGDRMILSSPGATIASPTGIAVELSGDPVVTDQALHSVFRVNSATGERTIISDGGTGAGPELRGPFSIAVEADGNFIVGDLSGLVRIDRLSGDRTALSPG